MGEPLYVEDLKDLKLINIVVSTGETDVETKTGYDVPPEMRLQQADWSYQQKRFSSTTAEYLPLFYPETWQQELENEHPSRQTRYIVGMIEMVTGLLAMMNQAGKFIPLLIHYPEQGLHPKYQTVMMSFLITVAKRYEETHENQV